MESCKLDSSGLRKKRLVGYLDKEMNCPEPEGFIDYVTNCWLLEKNCASLSYYYYYY